MAGEHRPRSPPRSRRARDAHACPAQLFASFGLYPIAGSDVYLLGSPAVASATLSLTGYLTPSASSATGLGVHDAAGPQLRVIAHDNSDDNVYVQRATLNGQPLEHAFVRHAAVSGGATLEFWMGPRPSAWAKGTAAAVARLLSIAGA